MPNFIVQSGDTFLKVEPPDKVTFISEKSLANRYTSKYAAKMHLRNLDGVPDNVKILMENLENG